jgi:hypothetical protein
VAWKASDISHNQGHTVCKVKAQLNNSAYYYIFVLLYLCPHTTAYVSSYFSQAEGLGRMLTYADVC